MLAASLAFCRLVVAQIYHSQWFSQHATVFALFFIKKFFFDSVSNGFSMQNVTIQHCSTKTEF